MYQMAAKGKYKEGDKVVGIAQTGTGWNVSTWKVDGKKIHTYRTQRTKTLAGAKKLFTQQKRKYLKLGIRKPKRKVSYNIYGGY